MAADLDTAGVTERWRDRPCARRATALAARSRRASRDRRPRRPRWVDMVDGVLPGRAFCDVATLVVASSSLSRRPIVQRRSCPRATTWIRAGTRWSPSIHHSTRSARTRRKGVSSTWAPSMNSALSPRPGTHSALPASTTCFLTTNVRVVRCAAAPTGSSRWRPNRTRLRPRAVRRRRSGRPSALSSKVSRIDAGTFPCAVAASRGGTESVKTSRRAVAWSPREDDRDRQAPESEPPGDGVARPGSERRRATTSDQLLRPRAAIQRRLRNGGRRCRSGRDDAASSVAGLARRRGGHRCCATRPRAEHRRRTSGIGRSRSTSPRSSSTRRRAIARDSRDLTVPAGQSSTVAISDFGELVEVAQGDHLPVGTGQPIEPSEHHPPLVGGDSLVLDRRWRFDRFAGGPQGELGTPPTRPPVVAGRVGDDAQQPGAERPGPGRRSPVPATPARGRPARRRRRPGRCRARRSPGAPRPGARRRRAGRTRRHRRQRSPIHSSPPPASVTVAARSRRAPRSRRR